MELVLNEVKKTYEKFSLNCSMKVTPGQVTGLIGKNGSGKSTTFKAVLGLITIDSGEVLIDGKTPAQLREKDRQKIGVVLAEAGFSGYLRVKDIVPVLRAMYEKFDSDFFFAQCERLELSPDKYIKDFSTGMRAKLKLLVALSHDAELLVLDEPTSGLDILARNQILDLLREYMEKGNRSILVSSHISGDLEGLCDDLYMIDNGKIILHEETDVLLDSYGLLKVPKERFDAIDRTHLLKVKKENFGYLCLTDQKKFYLDRYPQLVVEKGNIDETILMMIQGENV